MSNIHIRWMIRRDMPEVLRIEHDSFGIDAWTRDLFERCLQTRNCIGMIAEIDDVTVGFMIYEIHKNRLHLLNFATCANHRRRGVGRALVNKLRSKLSHERRNRIMLEVRETNLQAQVFFRALGFRSIMTLHNYFAEVNEDAYLMQYRYPPSVEELQMTHKRSR